MGLSTVNPGVLCVGSALPDPPFEFEESGSPAGFDVELTQAIARELGLAWRLVPYGGDDFNGIYDGLARGEIDCVASGATITPERQKVAAFCAPYLQSGQSLVCNIAATPQVKAIEDLRGMALGVQQGNTSEPVARRLKVEGRIAEVRTYPYHGIGAMLDDLDAARIGGIMKLSPVMHWMTRNRPRLRVVQEGITSEQLGVSVRLGNTALREAIDGGQERLQASGDLPRLIEKWLQPKSPG